MVPTGVFLGSGHSIHGWQEQLPSRMGFPTQVRVYQVRLDTLLVWYFQDHCLDHTALLFFTSLADPLHGPQARRRVPVKADHTLVDWMSAEP